MLGMQNSEEGKEARPENNLESKHYGSLVYSKNSKKASLTTQSRKTIEEREIKTWVGESKRMV